MPIARKARIFWPVVLLVFLADCSTKDLAETHLVPWVSEPVVGDVFRLTLAYNPQAAMSISLGEQSRPIISLIVLIQIGVLGYLYRKSTNRDTIKVLAIALVIAGAVETVPAGITPGSRATHGTRTPPSKLVPLPSRSGPAEPPWLP